LTAFRVIVVFFNRFLVAFFLNNFFTFLIVPGVPQDVKLLKVSASSAELEWKSPRKDEQHGQIRGYGIQYNIIESELKLNSLVSDLKPIKLKLSQLISQNNLQPKQFKYLISNLDANSTYKFEIFAFNAKGDGTRSLPLVVKTLVKSGKC
jgi:hypothetical protein